MTQIETVRLKDTREMENTVYTYPIPLQDQVDLVQLWQTEWDKTDFDWLESMKGGYSEHLAIRSVIGRIDGQPAGTASVSYSRHDPEVAVVGSVLTHPKFRSLGIAMHLTELVVQLACDAGCEACFLGTTRNPRSVYLRCGFEWWNGGVMRRVTTQNSVATEGDNFESRYFSAGQQTSIRDANWGDLPGTTCLVIQPLESLVIDYLRGLLSSKYVDLDRCVSNFPALWYDVTERGGAMATLIGETDHRVLGFGTITPGPGKGQSHKAMIDVMMHPNYAHEAEHVIQYLLHKARLLKIGSLQAHVALCDITKRGWFEAIGMQPMATLPAQLKVADEPIDVVVLERKIG